MNMLYERYFTDMKVHYLHFLLKMICYDLRENSIFCVSCVNIEKSLL